MYAMFVCVLHRNSLWAGFSSLYSLYWPLLRSFEIGARQRQKARQAQHRAWGGPAIGGQQNSRGSTGSAPADDTRMSLQQLLSTDAGCNSFRRYLVCTRQHPLDLSHVLTYFSYFFLHRICLINGKQTAEFNVERYVNQDYSLSFDSFTDIIAIIICIV
jgi:hypothetical protein